MQTLMHLLCLAGTGHLTALDAGGTGGLRTRCLPDGGARPEVEEL